MTNRSNTITPRAPRDEDPLVNRWRDTVRFRIDRPQVFQRIIGPSVADDFSIGYQLGNMWINTVDETAFFLIDGTEDAAVWQQLVPGTSSVVASASVLAKGETLVVPASTQTTVLSYTAPSDKKISKIVVSGQFSGLWNIEVGSVSQVEFRAAGGAGTKDIDYSTPWTLPSGSTMDIKVTHFATAKTFDYQATIWGF